MADDAADESTPAAPFRGEWVRGVEHETLLDLSCHGHCIRLRKPWGGGAALEWWLVESLWLWPHPNATRLDRPGGDGEWRHQCYERLKAKAAEEARWRTQATAQP